jgi:hypothetical protein
MADWLAIQFATQKNALSYNSQGHFPLEISHMQI